MKEKRISRLDVLEDLLEDVESALNNAFWETVDGGPWSLNLLLDEDPEERAEYEAEISDEEIEMALDALAYIKTRISSMREDAKRLSKYFKKFRESTGL